jgi:presenilin-like A22 family membrane protease
VKHTWKITFVLLAMFLVTQLIGLAVVYSYTYIPELPYGMEPPEEIDPVSGLISTLIAFVIAISLVFLLNKYRAKFILRAWFFIVVVIALGITLYSILFYIPEIRGYAVLIATVAALPLAYFKILKQNIIVHNLTELLIYPGIAAVFVSFFYFSMNPWMSIIAIVALLIFISAYDIWAVNHSGIMQKMAKFQIDELKLFAGFFVPYMDKKQRDKLRRIKQKYRKKDSKKAEKEIKDRKIKVSLAILGGGDVIFPIIAAGIFMKVLGLIPALLITAGASLSLLFLFTTARKGKFYPAMPFLTGGIFIGMILGLLIAAF